MRCGDQRLMVDGDQGDISPTLRDFVINNIRIGNQIGRGNELDVFSFGCVMLHTLCHQWPTPSQAVIINPEIGLATGGRTESERRSQCFQRLDRSRPNVLIPTFKKGGQGSKLLLSDVTNCIRKIEIL